VAEAKALLGTIAQLRELPKPLGEKALVKLHDAFLTAVDETDAANNARKRVVAKKHAIRDQLRTHIVQVRTAVRGIYGTDSTEYGEVGGTRASERRRPTRKPAGPAPAPAPH
jgi:hypothetical protein